MAWSERMSEGFLIAATVAGDRLAARARQRLAGQPAAQTRLLVDPLAALDDTQRRAAIASIVKRARAPINELQRSLPPRARGILAPLATSELGQRWLKQAPAPRAGFVAEPGLRAVLRAIAAEKPCRA